MSIWLTPNRDCGWRKGTPVAAAIRQKCRSHHGAFLILLRDLQYSSSFWASSNLSVLLPGAALRTARVRCEGSSAPAVNMLRKPRERATPSHPLPRPVRKCAGLGAARSWPRSRRGRPQGRTRCTGGLAPGASSELGFQRASGPATCRPGELRRRECRHLHFRMSKNSPQPAQRWPGSGLACSCPCESCCGSAALQPQRSRSTSKSGRRGDGVPAVPTPPAFPMPAEAPPSFYRGSSNLACCATPRAASGGLRFAPQASAGAPHVRRTGVRYGPWCPYCPYFPMTYTLACQALSGDVIYRPWEHGRERKG